MIAAKNLFLTTKLKFLESAEQKYSNTYVRANEELKAKEMMGYGGENGSMWTNAA